MIAVTFVDVLRDRAIAVEKQLIKHGFYFSVYDGEGIREWRLDSETVGEPDEALAKARELDPELILMAEVVDFDDPDLFDDDKGENL